MIEGILLLAIVLCLLAEAFFSGSETAVLSADSAQLHAAALEGDPRAALAERMMERVETVIGTTLVGTNLAVATGSSLATLLIALGDHVPAKWHSAAAILVMTPLILVFGEILPKSICRASAQAVTLHIARPLRRAQQAMFPLVWLVSKAADLLLRITGGGKADTQRCLSREELVVLAELGQEQGVIAPQERRMIQSLLELNDRPVSTAMAPLVDMAAVSEHDTPQTVKDLAARTGYARFPVYEGRVDNIVGIVALVDILSAEAQAASQEPRPELSLASFVQRNITFVPETMPIGVLLRELQKNRTPMVIAVDEHGGVAGLVTREDIVEEIVGDIRDERDRVQRHVAMHGQGAFECDGKLEIDSLNEQLGLAIQKEGFETVAGMVAKAANRIPKALEAFEYRGLRIEVLDADERRVKRVRIVRSGGDTSGS